MPIGKHPRDTHHLDGKEILTMWLEMGTIGRISKNLLSRGIVSPRTGRDYSSAAIVLSAWRWCIHNPDESFEMVSKFRLSAGEPLTREAWQLELLRHARTSLSSAQYLKFLKGDAYVR